MPAKSANWGGVLGTSKQRGVGVVAPADPSGQEGTPIEGAVYIRTDRIVPDTQQPRDWDAAGHREAFDTLVESIRQRGLMHPINVRYDPAQDIYIIISGEGRWRAVSALGLPKIKAICEYGDLTRDEILLRQLEENTVRADLTCGERLSALTALLADHDRAWIMAHSSSWRNESTLSRWATVAENRYLPDPEQVEQQIDTWEIAETKGITAAYTGIAERRQAEREETGRHPMGRPTGTAPPPPAPGFAAVTAPPAPLPSSLSSGQPAPPAAATWEEDEAATADAEDDQDTVSATWRGAPDTPPRVASLRPAASPVPVGAGTGRPSASPLAREPGGEAHGPGQDLGVISVDGTLYTITTARNLIARIQDSREIDALDQLLLHSEYDRWAGRAAAGVVEGWEADLTGLANWYEQKARTIRDAMGITSPPDDE